MLPVSSAQPAPPRRPGGLLLLSPSNGAHTSAAPSGARGGGSVLFTPAPRLALRKQCTVLAGQQQAASTPPSRKPDPALTDMPLPSRSTQPGAPNLHFPVGAMGRARGPAEGEPRAGGQALGLSAQMAKLSWLSGHALSQRAERKRCGLSRVLTAGFLRCPSKNANCTPLSTPPRFPTYLPTPQ